MKKTLTTREMVDALRRDQNAGWSYEGAKALIEYMKQLEEYIGEDIEFDPVALRCDYTEYENALDCVNDYHAGGDIETEKDALDYLESHTTVIQFHGGIIIQDF